MTLTGKVNLYDFDHTIYQGDASVDFIAHCFAHHPKLWKYLPTLAIALIKYVLGLSNRKQIKQSAFSFLRDLDNLDSTLNSFWKKHKGKVADWYRAEHRDDDIIISASPEFLLAPIAISLSVTGLIATKMNEQTGEIIGDNCRGEEKVKRLNAYGDYGQINHCYSDSISDMPILNLAEHPHIVKGNDIIALKDYTPPRSQTFKSATFLRFLLVGGINALLGILFSVG